MHENIFEQDNESAIKLEKNGRMSAGPKSRHVNIRYFWIKDRVKSEKITIRHCPTSAMLADFLTKPLQGQLFRKFRDVLLGRVHVNSLTEDHMVPLEERVGVLRAGYHGATAKSVLSTGTGTGTATAKNVSWADVVKIPAPPANAVYGQKSIKQSKADAYRQRNTFHETGRRFCVCVSWKILPYRRTPR